MHVAPCVRRFPGSARAHAAFSLAPVHAGASLIGPYFACLPRVEADLTPPAAALPLLAVLQRFVQTCELQRDALLFLTLHYCTVTGPLLLWTVSIVARRIERCQVWRLGGPGGRGARWVWLVDLVTAAPMVYVHVRFLRVVTAVMGWGPLLLGPAFGYVFPGCLLVLRAGGVRFAPHT